MALINCPECGRTISSASSKCPHCGYPMEGAAQNNQANQSAYQQTYQQPIYQQPVYEAPRQEDKPPCPETHLAKAILVTLLCCWPLGIPSIVYAARVNSLYLRGDYQGAEEASRNADKWFKIALGVGIGAGVLYLILYFLIFAAAGAGMMF